VPWCLEAPMLAQDATRLLLVLILGSVVAAAPAQAQKLFEKVTGIELTVKQQRALARIRAMPGTANVEIVKVDAGLLRTADRIDVSLDTVFQKTLQTRLKRTSGPDSFTWMATGEGDDSSATFSITNDIVGGSIFADRLYSIRPIGGGLNAFVTLDPKKFPPDHPLGVGQPSRGQRHGKRSHRTRSHRAQACTTIATTNTTDTIFIDVLVVLAKKAAALFPDAAEQLLMVNEYINTTNLSYLNSGVGIELRRSPSSPYLVDYEERGTTTDLNRLKETGDSFMNDIHSVRASDEADVVILVVDEASGFCGRAYTTMASMETAFAMVSAHCHVERLTFAHEIGHLQGASHDDEDGFFDCGHGHCNTAGEGTVMASGCLNPESPIRKPEWSRPPIWGSAAREHNVRVLNATAATVAGFLP
jgi:peptidyl-Asp metalloendopeptidase